MLQGVQNTSTFGYIAFTEGWLRYLANDAINFATFGKFKDSTYKQLATKTGALQIGVHDMLKGVAWKFNPGLMRQTERLNRYTTVAIGDVILKNGLQVLEYVHYKKHILLLQVVRLLHQCQHGCLRTGQNLLHCSTVLLIRLLIM